MLRYLGCLLLLLLLFCSNVIIIFIASLSRSLFPAGFLSLERLVRVFSLSIYGGHLIARRESRIRRRWILWNIFILFYFCVSRKIITLIQKTRKKISSAGRWLPWRKSTIRDKDTMKVKFNCRHQPSLLFVSTEKILLLSLYIFKKNGELDVWLAFNNYRSAPLDLAD